MNRSTGSAGHSIREAVSTPLALDLTDRAVTLYARMADNGWSAVATVATDADDFLAEMAELRTEARVRDERDGPITLWLPPEQVLVRTYELAGSGPDARQDARERLAAETTYGSSDLMFAFSPHRPDAPTTVLAALTQTVREAREYATKWGFTAGSVSTREAADAFGSVPPVFRAPEPVSFRVARRASVFGVAACVIAGALVGIYALSQLVDPLAVPKIERPQSGLVFAMVQVRDNEHPVNTAPLKPVGKGSVQTLALQRAFALRRAHEPELSQQVAVPVHLKGAPQLPTPRTRQRLKIGSAAKPPVRQRPGRLDATMVLPPRKPISLARADIDAARADGLDQAVTANIPRRRATSSRIEASAGSLVAAVLPNAAAPIRGLGTLSPNLPDTRAEANTPPDEADKLAPTALAPLNSDTQPRRRPGQQATAKIDVTEPDTQTPVAPVVAAANGSLVLPQARPAQPIVTGADTTEQSEADPDDGPTRYAALSAPAPRTRPRSIESKPVLRQPSTSQAPNNAPRSVRSAASQTGLAMGETNLIGVLQGSNGRQALVRLRNGGYLKVSRGDDVEGWRVRSIGRETLRLSRRGQNRTLMLVSR